MRDEPRRACVCLVFAAVIVVTRFPLAPVLTGAGDLQRELQCEPATHIAGLNHLGVGNPRELET